MNQLRAAATSVPPITFLLIGLGAGALWGLMFAPKPGKQFRRDLQRGYEDAKDNFGDWADEAKDRVREVSDRVRDAASRGADFAEELARPRRTHSPRHEAQLIQSTSSHQESDIRLQSLTPVSLVPST